MPIPSFPTDLLATARARRRAEVRATGYPPGGAVRMGTAYTATAPLLNPAIRAFRAAHAAAQVELVNTRHEDIRESLLEGRLDLGLVNLLAGDEPVPDLETTELIRGRAAVCCRADSPLAGLASVAPSMLLSEPVIAMRAGSVMHRYVHRLFHGQNLKVSFSADGAEMGKLMVAQGLGCTILPDYTVVGDPLERSGIITHRPLATDDATVTLVVQRSLARRLPGTAEDLRTTLMEHAAAQARPVPAGGPATH